MNMVKFLSGVLFIVHEIFLYFYMIIYIIDSWFVEGSIYLSTRQLYP